MNLKEKTLRVKVLSDTLRDLKDNENAKELVSKAYEELIKLVGERKAEIIFKKYF